jgi:transposase
MNTNIFLKDVSFMGKHHDKEFKMQAARLVVEEGKKPKALAEELDVALGTLRNWISAYKDKEDEGFVGSGNVPPEIASVREMEKQIEDLKEENKILKKAMHIFAREPK